jgi:hypothetical protein
MKKALGLLALLGACLTMLVAVTSAGAVSSADVRAGGTVYDRGHSGPQALFKMMLSGVSSSRGVSYAFGTLRFHSQRITSVLYGENAVKVQGLGVYNGKTVRFTAVGVSHPLARDVFKISWGGGQSHGGIVTYGHVRITPTA